MRSVEMDVFQQTSSPFGCQQVTLAGSGRRAGVPKRGPFAMSPKTRSSLCKAAMLQRFLGIVRLVSPSIGGASSGSDDWTQKDVR